MSIVGMGSYAGADSKLYVDTRYRLDLIFQRSIMVK